MLDLPRLIANSHLVEHDAVCPHVNCRTDPDTICHFWRLVFWSANAAGHVSHTLHGIDQMTKAKVNYLCDRTILEVILFILLLLRLFEHEYIINFDVCVYDTSLVHVPDASQYVLGPDRHLVILHRFVLAEDPPRDVVTANARIFHVDNVICLSLRIM